jgi:DNA polymerase-3 subunit alpha
MKLLIFDTETTGLPKSRKSFEEGPDNWPHIVSISWVIYDAESNSIEKQRKYIINPMGWEIPEEVVRIHGIDAAKAKIQGHPLKDVLSEFMAEPVQVLVAHNMEFDYNVVCSAIKYDLDMEFKGFPQKRYCTMELSREICKLKTLFGKPKAPKLSELYECVFKRQPIPANLHDSLYDTLILTEIIQHCHELRLKMNLPSLKEEDAKNDYSKDRSKVLSLDLRK